MEVINTYAKIFLAAAAFIIAVYGTFYSNRVHVIKKKFPIPLSPTLSVALRYNFVISWAIFIIVLELLLVG